LHFDVRRSEDRVNLGSVVAASRYSIEIHDMEMAETVLSPRDCDSDGIRDTDHLFVIGAGSELNAGAATQVKRRNCDHRARKPVRARIMRRSVAMIAGRRACE
jgi:hypothetical protein